MSDAVRPAIGMEAGLERVMGDHDMFVRVLGRFGVDYRDLTIRLHAALDSGDAVLAQRIAHTLKGAAGMIEANHLRALALDVELALKAGSRLSLALIGELDAELARVLEEIDGLLARPVAAPASAPVTEVADDTPDLNTLRAMLDIGDGRAPELLDGMRAHLLVELGPDRLAALEAAVGRFDFERALALLEAPLA